MSDFAPSSAGQHPQHQQLAVLASRFPWPTCRPDAPFSSWGWGIASKDLLQFAVPRNAGVILEIGSLLGASARFFATQWPSAHVICVDPWTDIDGASQRPFLKHVPELVPFMEARRNGLFDVFVASNWEFRHRITPVRGFSPDCLSAICETGVTPDAVYVDGSHAFDDVLADLIAVRTLFPNAVICGDDWSWLDVRRAVTKFCRLHGCKSRAVANTWALFSNDSA